MVALGALFVGFVLALFLLDRMARWLGL